MCYTTERGGSNQRLQSTKEAESSDSTLSISLRSTTCNKTSLDQQVKKSKKKRITSLNLVLTLMFYYCHLSVWQIESPLISWLFLSVVGACKYQLLSLRKRSLSFILKRALSVIPEIFLCVTFHSRAMQLYYIGVQILKNSRNKNTTKQLH